MKEIVSQLPLVPFLTVHSGNSQVTEGWDVLDAINEAFVDPDGRPYQNIRYVKIRQG